MDNPCNLTMAQEFITALTGSRDAPLTWQVLPDGAVDSALKHHYIAEYHGPLAQLAKTLSVWNTLRGSGVFYMVNQGTGGHRTAQNVTGLRALFIDDDKGAVDPTTDFDTCPPSAIVRTRRGVHVYWFLRANEPLHRFSPAQRALIRRFGTDPSIHDLPRIMRTPGFLHQKDPANPVLVRTLALRPERRYSIDEVLRAFGLGLEAPASERRVRSDAFPLHFRRRPHTPGSTELIDVLNDSALLEWARNDALNLRYPAWRAIGTNLAAAGLDGDEGALCDARDTFLDLDKFHEGGESYTSLERQHAWAGIVRSAEAYGPATWAHLADCGVPARIAAEARTRSPVGDARVVLAERKLARAMELLGGV